MRAVAKPKLPEGGLCFDYFFDEISGQWVPWSTMVEPYEPVTDVIFNNIIISTTDIVRWALRHKLLQLLNHVQAGVLLSSFAGALNKAITLL